MTRDEAVARIQQGLSFRTTNADEIATALQEAQRYHEKGKTLPWFLQETDYTLTGTDANTASVAQPTGFLRLVDEERPKLYNSSGVFVHVIEVGDFDQLSVAWKGSTKTTPYAMAIRASTFHFFPTPTSAYTIKLSYYKAGDILASGGDENVWLANAPDLLIATAGLLMAADLMDERAEVKFGNLEKRAARDVFVETIARQEAGRDRIMGGNH